MAISSCYVSSPEGTGLEPIPLDVKIAMANPVALFSSVSSPFGVKSTVAYISVISVCLVYTLWWTNIAIENGHL